MNKNLMVTLFTVIIAIGIAAVAITIHFRPDATATMLNSVTTLLGLLSGFAILVHGLSKVNDKVVEVHKQTNGTLSKKDDEIQSKDQQILALTAALAAQQQKEKSND